MAVRALISQLGHKFEMAMRRGRFHVLKGNNLADLDDMGEEEVGMMTSKEEIHFIPETEGSSGILRAVIGVVMVVVGVYFQQPWLVQLGAGMILGGVASLIAGTPKTTNQEKSNVAQNPSFVFNGPINTVAQGGPIPLVFGRYRTGSTVISAGLDVAKLAV
jgi:predicted phage tail protein